MKVLLNVYVWYTVIMLCACGGNNNTHLPPKSPPLPPALAFANNTPTVQAQSINNISVNVASNKPNTQVVYFVLVAGSAAPTSNDYFNSSQTVGRFEFSVATKNTVVTDSNNENLMPNTTYDVYIAIKSNNEKLIPNTKISVTTRATGTTQTYPSDPNKRAVNGVDLSGLKHPFTLAYDQTDPTTIYHGIRAARIADTNGQVSLGYTAAQNGGFLNAQLSFGASRSEINLLKEKIRNAGFIPFEFPVTGVTIRPVVPGLDRETGSAVCALLPDPETGAQVQICEAQILDGAPPTSSSGPTLTENFVLSYNVNPFGAKVYQRFLSKGHPLQVNIELAYIKVGKKFTSDILVDYDKLINNYIAFYSVCNNDCSDTQVEIFFKKEGLCIDRDKALCGITANVKNGAGNTIPPVTLPVGMSEQEFYQAVDNPTLNNPSDELLNAMIVWQSVERLMQALNNKMFVLIGQRQLQLASEPTYSNKLNTTWVKSVKGTTQNFNFQSPNGLNRGRMVIPTGLACVIVANNGTVSAITTGVCAGYWNGTVSFGEVLNAQF